MTRATKKNQNVSMTFVPTYSH